MLVRKVRSQGRIRTKTMQDLHIGQGGDFLGGRCLVLKMVKDSEWLSRILWMLQGIGG